MQQSLIASMKYPLYAAHKRQIAHRAYSFMGRPYVTMIYGVYILFLFTVADNAFARHARPQGMARRFFFREHATGDPIFSCFPP